MTKLKPEILNGTIKTFMELSPRALQGLNIDQESWELFTGEVMWTADSRPKVRRVMESLIHGAIELAGLDPFQVPAEYRACVIACFVNPINWQVACHETCKAAVTAAEDLELGKEREKVTREKLFALIMQAKSENVEAFRDKFIKSVDRSRQKSVKV